MPCLCFIFLYLFPASWHSKSCPITSPKPVDPQKTEVLVLHTWITMAQNLCQAYCSDIYWQPSTKCPEFWWHQSPQLSHSLNKGGVDILSSLEGTAPRAQSAGDEESGFANGVSRLSFCPLATSSLSMIMLHAQKEPKCWYLARSQQIPHNSLEWAQIFHPAPLLASLVPVIASLQNKILL